MSLHFFLVAGEPSGDFLGAELMKAIKLTAPQCQFSGVGGAGMEAEGLQSLFPMSELSIIGLVSILRHYRRLKRRIAETAQAAIAKQPDAVITIDSQEFSWRVMRAVKAASPEIRTVHYVAPTVWAWRPNRALALAKIADQVLALFPFEPPYFERHGLRCDFVGHPIAKKSAASPEDIAAFRKEFHLCAASPLLVVLPGSRSSEIKNHTPILTHTLNRLARSFPELRVIVPTVEKQASKLKTLIAKWPGKPILLASNSDYGMPFEVIKQTAFSAADLALAAAGTVTLELAAAKTPMVAFYKLNWLSYMFVLILKTSDRISLVNIVAGKDVVSELIGRKCNPAMIAKTAHDLLRDQTRQSLQIEVMGSVMKAIGQDSKEPPAMRAARAVLDGVSQT